MDLKNKLNPIQIRTIKGPSLVQISQSGWVKMLDQDNFIQLQIPGQEEFIRQILNAYGVSSQPP